MQQKENRVIQETIQPREIRVCFDLCVPAGETLEYIIGSDTELPTTGSAPQHVVRRFSVAEGARLTVWDQVQTNTPQKSTIVISLDGPHAHAEILGMFYGIHDHVFDIHHEIVHRAPMCTSRILTRGVLDDHARAAYYSKIHIAPGAFGSVAQERADTLLLSKDASITAVPDLSIENNDVVCRHAVTTSRIDKTKLFYFASRGIAAKEAIEAIVDGHFAPVFKRQDLHACPR